MNEFSECDFIVDSERAERDYPIAQLTGWETVVFRLQEESDITPFFSPGAERPRT